MGCKLWFQKIERFFLLQMCGDDNSLAIYEHVDLVKVSLYLFNGFNRKYERKKLTSKPTNGTKTIRYKKNEMVNGKRPEIHSVFH